MDANNVITFQTNTAGKGVAPCHAQLSNTGQFAVIDSTGAVLFTTPAQPLANGQYTIQNIGTAAEQNAQCGTYLGYPVCGGGTALASLLPTNPNIIAWQVINVGGPMYTIQAVTREGCDPATYLSSSPCATGSNAIYLATTNDGTGNQVWHTG